MKRHGTTVNDVLLAAVAGALRRFLLEHGEEPRRLKAMVPVNVRDPQIQDGLGNHISFVFVGLPCTEPEPRARLADIAGQMRRRKEDREPEGADVALQGPASRRAWCRERSPSCSPAPASSTSWSRTCRGRRSRSTCAAAAYGRCIRSCRSPATMPSRSG
jgi:hypothetical protein